MAELYPCPICGTRCLSEEYGSFDICPVCGWEEDGITKKYPDKDYGTRWSLNSAKKAWANGETLFAKYPNPKAKKS